MMRGLLAVAVVMAWAAVGLGAPPSIDGPEKVDPYTLIVLTPKDFPADAVPFWDFSPEDAVSVQENEDGSVTWTAPPGVYAVKARYIGKNAKGKSVPVTVRKTVKIGDPPPIPNPMPGPGPNPKPNPGPVAPAALRLLVVENTLTAANSRGAWFTSAELAARVKAKGHSVIVVDAKVVDSVTGKTPADLAPWIALTAGKSLPQLFAVTDAGDVRYSGDLPPDPAGLLKLLDSIGG